MFKKFYPSEIAPSTYSIDFDELYQKGYRGILFDIDNTLVEHGADANEKAIALFQKLRTLGFAVCLISNNKKERVERFNKEIHANYIYDAHKPSRKNYLKAMELMKTTKDTTVFVGDQLFTDVYGANRVGMTTYLEKIVLFFYKRRK